MTTMVIDLQVTPPKAIGNTRKVYPDANGLSASYYRDQLTMIKTNLLNPAEVKFLNVNDGYGNETKRKRLTTISSEASDSESFGSSTTNKKKIPDGGYGWVIVFASLMVSLIADGVSFSFGLVYSELLDYFQEGTTKTAWVDFHLFFFLKKLSNKPFSPQRSVHCLCRFHYSLDLSCRT